MYCGSKSENNLNGRTFGDMFGKPTCYTTNGTLSVVDYIVSEDILSHVLYFSVNDFNPILSDCHCFKTLGNVSKLCYRVRSLPKEMSKSVEPA
jgi:hypothetical protein